MYTYAFLLNSDTPLDLPEGIWGSLELVGLADLAALVEPDLSAESLQQSDRQLMQAVLSHDRVIQEVFQQTAVLPLRFGTYFISRQGLLDHLRSHQREYLDKLTRLQGKAEYALKLVSLSFPETAIDPDTKGKDYFLAKKQRYQSQADWQQQQQTELQLLSSLIGEHYPDAVRGGEVNDGVERFYLLSSQQAEPQLQEHLAFWQQQCPHWEISLGEVLPPYHFV
jgi:Gas vesicle synthesis protein GvpL/GvpF